MVSRRHIEASQLERRLEAAYRIECAQARGYATRQGHHEIRLRDHRRGGKIVGQRQGDPSASRERFELQIDYTCSATSSRHQRVFFCEKAFQRDLLPEPRMAHACDADESFVEEDVAMAPG